MTTTRMILLLRAESKRHAAISRLCKNEAEKSERCEVAQALQKAADIIADMMLVRGGAADGV